MMMVAPGILTLMSGVNAHFDDNQRGFTGFLSQPCCAASTSNASGYANQNALGSCLGAQTDGTGGPYPAAATSDCQNQSVVPVFIVPDTRYDVGFSPSNITISRGGAVLFTSQQPGCTIQPWQEPNDAQGPFLQVSFDAPGTYRYSCQENPSIGGVIQVK
jgi:plastocyanin